ncbi:hypothetical protein RvY_13276-1 [Ramazzottius varieornatus]|uniref:Receptor ligand binding region domain-containing protein n=1 Tax=Ramazzottius varieornatus TaxID=947166 RepID=A0A1D1VVW1_RAMVA|nr:hypothetical protein RvY_13276-1 [Ramazzottius varieornatus]
MITAHRLNMTDGTFVFFFLQSCLFFHHVDILDETNDPPDTVNEQIFQPLIFVRFDYSYRLHSTAVFTEAARIALETYNYTFGKDDKMNDVGFSAFEAASALLQVLQELEHNHPEGFFTKDLYRSLINRTFHLETRDVSIDHLAYRLRNSYFCRFDNFSGNFQVLT